MSKEKSNSSLFNFLDDDDILGSEERLGGPRETVQDELKRWLDAPRINPSADPLKAWKKDQYQYPRLARAARTYLAIPGKYKFLLVHISINIICLFRTFCEH